MDIYRPISLIFLSAGYYQVRPNLFRPSSVRRRSIVRSSVTAAPGVASNRRRTTTSATSAETAAVTAAAGRPAGQPTDQPDAAVIQRGESTNRKQHPGARLLGRNLL